MNENKKWGYIFDEKLNMYIPDLSRQKKLANIFLILSLVSFATILIQIYFFYQTFYEKISFLVYSSIIFFLFFTLYLVLKINIHLVEKRLEEIKGLKLEKDFEVKALKNRRFFAYIMICIYNDLDYFNYYIRFSSQYIKTVFN